jgi:hypothetical protein
MSARFETFATASLFVLLSACAVEGADSSGEDDGVDCTGEKCDDIAEAGGGSGITVVNPCSLDLVIGLVSAGSSPLDPAYRATIPRGGSRSFPGDHGDRLLSIDVGGSGWRQIASVDGPGRLDLDPGFCPWDVFVESGMLPEKAGDGGDWDPTAVGDYTRPDPYVTGYGDGGADDCRGHPTTEGSPTSTAHDTTAPSWNQETLSWIAWHDMSWGIDLVVTDDDVGLGGEPMGTCRVEGIPAPSALPAVITADCVGGGSMTIRIEPADPRPVQTENVPIGGVCS